ncbi:MAG: 3-dehydroquinate synthase [Porticoccaceae bacterium]|jgi:3-dehydroquinate synthase|nr:3-dehydroquinate synthase [Porticoccaceae bacterium]
MSVADSTISSPTKSINVDLGERSYPIHIGSEQILRAGIGQYVQGKKVLIVSNETIAPLYLPAVLQQLQDKQVDQVILKDGEQYKTLDNLNLIFTQLIEKQHDRKTTLIALGGGVVGDMTGFAAASYQRGVPFIQIPTTLLAQVDSSVGGKTAVNHALGKNMIGAFYQPQAVIIDTDTLATLPEREFCAGMAEVIKYGLISDDAFFLWLEENVEALLNRDPQALAYAIERSCLNKAKVVSADETEQGVRAILNLGHTFGHAIETFQRYTGLLHGEAVAVGMAMAAELSMLSGALSQQDMDRTKALIASFSLPVAPPQAMQADDFMTLMVRDKKVLDGQLRLVLLTGIGSAVVTADFRLQLLEETLNKACNR